VAFNPDGTRLASASMDATIRLWDVATGQELLSIKGNKKGLRCVAFSPDGTRLASCGVDGTVQLWDARLLTPKVRSEVEAVALLRLLFAKPLPKRVLHAAVQKQLILSTAARQKALELANRFSEETDPNKYFAAAWPVVLHPYSNVFMCQDAIAQLQAACERAPGNGDFRVGLAVAHYRLGKFQKERYEQALALLEKCPTDYPPTLAFLAMTQHRLGHQGEARASLDRLRKLLQKPQWGERPLLQVFRAEAEALLQPAAEKGEQ
jgi:tetratricopeptide (TPR) repeat protein